MYLTVCKAVVEDTVTAFCPTVIVLQCGTESLGCDWLGAFNLSISAHGKCVNFIRKYNVPFMMLGVAVTPLKMSVDTGQIQDDLPVIAYDSLFCGSQGKFHPPLKGRVVNPNTSAPLQKITISIRNKLKYLQDAPSVATREKPHDLEGLLADEHKNQEKDEERESGFVGSSSDRYISGHECFDNDVDEDDCGPQSGTTRNSISPSVRKPRAKHTRGQARGEAGGTDEREDSEVDESSSVRAGKTSRIRSRARPLGRVTELDKDAKDIDANVASEPKPGFEPAIPVDVDVGV
ncbi:hypothetical protein BKA82DRAFT_4428110 [Pisolithus tinctorius]|nr:hypothetical protein BKA82DRAFT_4428110 [Pisolithus tinctorius]